MPLNKLIKIGAFAFAATIIFFTFSGSEENYIEHIEKYRADYQESLQVSDDSPFKDQSFSSLSYFKPNSDYRVDTEIIPLTTNETISLITNKNENHTYIKRSLLVFTINGHTDSLTLLENIKDPSDLFLPFTDETSTHSTYGTGRYLPVAPSKTGTIELDFNMAFNPYCAYNIEYSCPIPPKENHINIEILAGEKNYSDH